MEREGRERKTGMGEREGGRKWEEEEEEGEKVTPPLSRANLNFFSLFLSLSPVSSLPVTPVTQGSERKRGRQREVRRMAR